MALPGKLGALGRPGTVVVGALRRPGPGRQCPSFFPASPTPSSWAQSLLLGGEEKRDAEAGGGEVLRNNWAAPVRLSGRAVAPIKMDGPVETMLVTVPQAVAPATSTSLVLCYSFPPGGLQGGFGHPLSLPPGLRLSFLSCLHWCFPDPGRVPVVWEGRAAPAVASGRGSGSLTCSALRGSFSEWATHSFIKSRMMGMRLTTPP